MWVHGVLLIYVMSRYHIVEIMCTYTLNLKYTVCNLVTVVTLIWYCGIYEISVLVHTLHSCVNLLSQVKDRGLMFL